MTVPYMTAPSHHPVVIITGASSGIGRCTAGVFAREGWAVGLIARGLPGLQAAATDVRTAGTPAATAVADVTDPAALDAAADAIEAALGPADIWVNCAGNGTFGRFLDIPPAEFAHVLAVTFGGTANGTRTALRRMAARGRGHIVNVCSGVAYQGMPLLSGYSAAKHAVRGFDQAIRAELRQERSPVQLSTVFPPAVNTPFFDHAPSYLGAPGRPIPPVYQPEVVAAAIHHAATSRRGREWPVTFTTVAFSWGVRLLPALVRRAVHRLGYAGQTSLLAGASARHAPSLFTLTKAASPVHGAYGEGARHRSLQVSLLRMVARRRQSGRDA